MAKQTKSASALAQVERRSACRPEAGRPSRRDDARITKCIDTKADRRPNAGAAEQADDRRVALDAEGVNREVVGGQGTSS